MSDIASGRTEKVVVVVDASVSRFVLGKAYYTPLNVVVYYFIFII